MHVASPSATKVDWRIINYLRGLAALYVVINHSRGQLFTDAADYAAHVQPKDHWNWWEWLNMLLMNHTGLGPEFVILFFILSGFSIAHSLSGNTDTGKFYVRRLIRLYPTYIIGLLWAIVVFFVIKWIAPAIWLTALETDLPVKAYYNQYIEWGNMLKNILYIPTNNFLTRQYWSLPLEVVFYLLAPWVIKRFKWYSVITISLAVLGFVLNGVEYEDLFTAPLAYMYMFDFGLYFLVGVAFYKYKDLLTRNFIPGKWAMWMLLLALFEFLVYFKGHYWILANKLSGYTMILFTYLILFGSFRHNIRIKWLEKIGAYSYTLYVTHLATIHIMCAVTFSLGLGFYHIHQLYMWYLGIVLSVGVAYGLYFLAEYPSTKYLERLRKK